MAEKHLVTQKEFEKVRDQMFMVFVYKQSGEYYQSHRGVSFLMAMRVQQEQQINGNITIIYPLEYHHHLPVIPIDHKLDPHTLGFKLAVLPLMYQPYNPHLKWAAIEDFCRSNGYYQERIDYRRTLEVNSKEILEIENTSTDNGSERSL